MLLEASVRGRAFRQPELLAEDVQVFFDRRVVVSVDDGNGSFSTGVGQMVDFLDLGRGQSGGCGACVAA